MTSPTTAESTHSEIPRSLLYLWLAFLGGSLLLWLSCYIFNRYGYGFPYATPFPHNLFEDIRIYIGRFETFHTPAFFEYSRHSHFAYPAGAAVLYQAVYATHRIRSTYCIVSILWAVFGIGVFTAALLRRRVHPIFALLFSITCCLAFPFIFLIQRGNIEIALWIFAGLGILAYMRRSPYLAAILWGVAASIKIYPIFFLGIFLNRRREIGPILAGIASAILSTLLELWYVGPSILTAFRGFLGGVQGFQGAYAQTVRSAEMGFDHSLFSLFKLFAIAIGRSPGTWLHPYYLIAGTITALIFLLRVRKLPFANRLLFLTLAFILLPPVSYEYTLVHLYAPAAVLVLYAFNHAANARPGAPATPIDRSLLLALACFVVLVLPVNLFVFHGILYAGQIQILPLLLLAVLAARYPWRNSWNTLGPRSTTRETPSIAS